MHCCGNPIHDFFSNLPAAMPFIVLVAAWFRAKVRG